MKYNQWTLGLAAVGAISLASVTQAEEAQHAVMTALQSTTISGYVDTSAIWMPGPSVKQDDNIPGRSFTNADKMNGVNLNVVSLTIEKPLDEGQWSAGYKASVWLGPDANTLASQSVLADGAGDFAIRNAYVALRAPVGNGLDVKMGVFDTVVGYEVADGPYNPNYTRSLGFYLEPITHTGALFSYQFTEWLSAQAGMAESALPTINLRSGVRGVKTYMGSIALTAPESMGALEGATLYGGILDFGVDQMNNIGTDNNPHYLTSQDVVSFYAGVTVPLPLEGWAVGAAYDYRANALFDGSYENAVGGYVSWQATDKLRFNVRGEYATGSNGSIYNVGGMLVSYDGAYGVPYAGSDNVKLVEATATVDYRLWANAITRLEFRWDHSASGQKIYTENTRKNAYMLALNVIYQF